MERATRNYIAYLLALIFLCVLESVFCLTIESRYPNLTQNGHWVFESIASVYAVYGAAIIATLIIRWRWPEIGRIVTKALNLFLLLFFPFGTAVGVYGLRKVDKDNQLTPTPSPSSSQQPIV